MRATAHLVIMLLAVGGIALQPAVAEQWPGWRGPRGDGSSAEQDVPLQWDAASGENIVWKINLPGQGHSSPIAWGDRLFLSTCLSEQQQRLLLCFDTRTGKELWRVEVLTAPLETIHRFNSFASATPATDGELVYVPFLNVSGQKVPAPNVGAPRDITPGRIVLTAIDFDGSQRWQADVGDFLSAHGFCSSPVIYKDLVILNGDHDGAGYLVALDRRSGREVWRTPREQGIRSYVTPIIRNIQGQDQLVLSGSGHIASFDPASGTMLWKVRGPAEQFVASMVFDGERFIIAAGYPTHHVMAIDPTGRGDVTDSHVAWHVDQHVRCYVPSPVLIGDRLFVADDRGTASCFDSTDGTRIWQGRLAGSFSASPVATSTFAFFLSGDGVTKVIQPDRQLKVIATNPIGAPCSASPAISNGQIYIRGHEHLFCIGSAESAERPSAAERASK